MLAADIFSAYWEAGWNNPEVFNIHDAYFFNNNEI